MQSVQHLYTGRTGIGLIADSSHLMSQQCYAKTKAAFATMYPHSSAHNPLRDLSWHGRNATAFQQQDSSLLVSPVQCVQFSILLVQGGPELGKLSMQVLHCLLQGSQFLRGDTVQVVRAATPDWGPGLSAILCKQLLLRLCQCRLQHRGAPSMIPYIQSLQLGCCATCPATLSACCRLSGKGIAHGQDVHMDSRGS